MSRARDTRRNNALVTAEYCDENHYNSDFICEYCPASVEVIYSYERQHFATVVLVLPFFRLERFNVHDTECPHDPLQCVRSIARASDASGISWIEDKQCAVVSLQILCQPRSTAQAIRAAGLPPDDTPAFAVIVDHSGTARPYINTLQKVIKLRQQVEQTEGLRKHLVLMYRGRPISWDKFYFDIDSYEAAFRLLHESPKRHPICIYGIVKSIAEPKEGFPFYSFKLVKRYVEPTAKHADVTEVEVNCPPDLLNPSLEEGRHVLVYGLAIAKLGNRGKAKDGSDTIMQFQDIKFQIYHPDQILVLDQN